jgi:serine protease Do
LQVIRIALRSSVAFPASPRHGDSPEQFLIQDPFSLRKRVLPILTINRATGLLTGLGTGFRADPFETYLTAEHVLKDHFEALEAGDNSEIATVLFSMGPVFGKVGLMRELFAPVSAVFAMRSLHEEPEPLLGQPASRRIILDLMRFHLDMSSVPDGHRTPPVPIRTAGFSPSVGDRVMAVGYPELTCLQGADEKAAIVITERMYGAVGTISGLLPKGRGRSYPWPTLEVEANWRSGMSGGPVFNEAGEVIGIVSSSVAPSADMPGVGFAVDFSRTPLPRMVPSIVANHPGSYRGYGVVQGNPWRLAGLFPDVERAEQLRAMLGPKFEVHFGTNRSGTDDFIW